MSMKIITEDGEILPVPRNLPSGLFEDFDRMDEEQIVRELMGGAVEEYVYSFKQGEAVVTGLSVTGVMAVAQHMGGITCDDPPRWEITDDEYYCEIKATDRKTGLTLWGSATQPRMMRAKGVDKPDSFARQKALSKAQRNAIRKLIPEPIAVEMLGAFSSGKRPGNLPPVQRRAPTPALSDGQPDPPGMAAEMARIKALAKQAQSQGAVRLAWKQAKQAGIETDEEVRAEFDVAWERVMPAAPDATETHDPQPALAGALKPD